VKASFSGTVLAGISVASEASNVSPSLLVRLDNLFDYWHQIPQNLLAFGAFARSDQNEVPPVRPLDQHGVGMPDASGTGFAKDSRSRGAFLDLRDKLVMQSGVDQVSQHLLRATLVD
jgi:uncharacterized protein (UPF0276 family)